MKFPIIKVRDKTNGKVHIVGTNPHDTLDFALGNAVKYIARSNHKGDKLDDLKKAIWYLQRELDTLDDYGKGDFS